MGTVLLIILVLGILVIFRLRRHPEKVQAWLARRLMKNMKRQMEEAQRRQRENFRQRENSSRQRQRRQYPPRGSEPIIPKEYAQDVEFTESKCYSSDSQTTVSSDADGNVEVESQVSDVEWEEMKIK